MFNLGFVNKGISAATKVVGKGALLFKHMRPEILTGAGVIGIGAFGILVAVATLKVEPVVDKAKERIDDIKALDLQAKDSEKKELAIVYTKTGIELAKIYALPVAVGTISILCIIGSNRILRKENATLAAAYMGLSEAFKKYRQRVIANVGEDEEKKIRYGVKTTAIETVDENGTKTMEHIEFADPETISIYARRFDESNPNWSRRPEGNLLFLRCQQNTANDWLHSRGHVFLNEVYDMLGLPRSEAGCMVGWVNGHGDDCIDFGAYETYEPGDGQYFIDQLAKPFTLDFNVDGPIMYIFDDMNFKRRMLDAKA